MPATFTHAVTPTSVPAARRGELRRLAFRAMGTSCEVQYVAAGPRAGAEVFERTVAQWVEEFEARYSRFRPNSLISRINAAAGQHWVEVDLKTEQLFALCDSIYRMTSGVLDPTILPLLHLWDWKAENPVVPSSAELTRAHALVGWSKVQRQPGKVFLPLKGMALDFGGFGKEFAADIVAELAVQHGISQALVDFGHDLRTLGAPPGRLAWHVGLEDPTRPGQSAGSLAVRGHCGVASSGDYLRCFHLGGRRYGHIIDPRTGWPVANGSLQATVVADTCLQAGVLSTAAFVLGVPAGIDYIAGFPGAEGLIITDTVRAQTRGFHTYVAS